MLVGIAWLIARSSHRRKQVASDSPGYSRDAETSSSSTLQGKAGENGQPGGCLCKSSLQETVGYAGGKLPAGVANDWVTRRSPVPCFADLRVSNTLFLPRSPCGDLLSRRAALAALRARYGGSMYSLACRTPGIIPRNYCSLRDRGGLKRAPREAWTLRGPLRQRLPLRERRERNPALGAPPALTRPPPCGRGPQLRL